MKRKAVLINTKFLPEANGVIACLKNISPYFSEYFDLTIVTAKTVFDTKKYDRFQNAKIIRLSNLFDDLYIFFKDRFYSKTEEEKAINKNVLFKITNALNARLMFLFEALSKRWGVSSARGYEKNFYNALTKLNLEFDYVICPVMPRVNAFIAMKILENSPEKKMIFLQLDMYSRNPDLQHIGREKLKDEQRKFYEQAAVVAIQPGFMPYIEEDFSDFSEKIIPLHVPSLNKFSGENDKSDNISDNKILNEQNTEKNEVKIVYAGSFLETIRPPKPMLQFFKTICDANKNIKLHLLSWGCPDIVNEYKRDMGDSLILHGFLPMDEASAIIESADILVNIGNTVKEMMPSKTFEYIGRRKPIIHFYFFEDDIGKAILNDYPMKLFVDANNIDDTESEYAVDFILKNKKKLCDIPDLKEKYACYTAEYYVDTLMNYLGLEKDK